MLYHSNEYPIQAQLNTCVNKKIPMSSFIMDWLGKSPSYLYMLREDPSPNQLDSKTLISCNPKSDSDPWVILHCKTLKHYLKVCHTFRNLCKVFLVDPSRVSLVQQIMINLGDVGRNVDNLSLLCVCAKSWVQLRFLECQMNVPA